MEILRIEDKSLRIVEELKKKKVVPDQFGFYNDNDYFINDEDYDISAAIDKIHIPHCREFGASKFVIIPDYLDYVIKIPFNGFYFYEDKSYYDEKYGEWVEDEDGEYLFEDFDDHCAIEYENYCAAEDEHLEFLFAKTEPIMEVARGIWAYRQEKITDGVDSLDFSISEESYKKANTIKSGHSCSISNEWLANVVEWYGSVVADALLSFIEKRQINDLHNGNLGYAKDGSPKILDYSGWWG